jgi:tetratricopeptide (TPR) repeat protein
MLHNSAEAEPLLRASLATYLDELGERHPKYFRTLGTLSGILIMRNRLDEASAMLHRTLELSQEVYGRDHTYNLDMLQNLAFCHEMANDLVKGLAAKNDAVDMSLRLFGENSLRVVDTLIDRADVQGRMDNHDAADADYRRALDIAKRIGMDKEQLACICRLGIASNTLRSTAKGQPGNVQEAVALVNEVLAIEETNTPTRRWTRGMGMSLLGEAKLQDGAFAQAEQLLLEAFETFGTGRLVIGHRRAAANRLLRVYEAWERSTPNIDKSAEIAKWTTMAEALAAPNPMPEASVATPD